MTATATASPRLIAVASGKGGVGKTWLSITLAHSFARKGERVLLFDGDLGLANVDVQLGLDPKHDVTAVFAGRLTLTEAVTPVEGGAGAGGFDVLAGRSGSGALAALTKTQLDAMTRALRLVSGHYDRTIVDLGAGIDPIVLTLVNASDTALVILNDEPTSLTDAYALIKVASRARADHDWRVAVNTVPTHEEGRKVFASLSKACRGFLGFEPALAGVVRRDSRVRDAIRAQTPFLTRSLASPAAEDVAALAIALARPRAATGRADGLKALK